MLLISQKHASLTHPLHTSQLLRHSVLHFMTLNMRLRGAWLYIAQLVGFHFTSLFVWINCGIDTTSGATIQNDVKLLCNCTYISLYLCCAKSQTAKSMTYALCLGIPSQWIDCHPTQARGAAPKHFLMPLQYWCCQQAPITNNALIFTGRDAQFSNTALQDAVLFR